MIGLLIGIPLIIIVIVYQRGKSSGIRDGYENAIRQLEYPTDTTASEKGTLRQAADYLRSRSGILAPAYPVTQAQSEGPVVAVQPVGTLTDQPTITPDISTIVSTAAEEPPHPAMSSANILLFIGAFLMIAAATTFASYIGTMSLFTQAGLLALFGTGFYLGGGLLSRKGESLMPAAIVFTVIGMVTVPLIGYLLTRDQADSSLNTLTWTITSASAALIYLTTLRRFAYPFFAYCVSAATVSTAVTFTRLILGDSSYVLAFGMALSGWSLLISRITLKNQTPLIDRPFHIISLVSMALSFIFGLSEAAVTGGASFYQTMTLISVSALIFAYIHEWMHEEMEERSIWIYATRILLALTTYYIAGWIWPLVEVRVVVVLAVAAIYVLLGTYLPRSTQYRAIRFQAVTVIGLVWSIYAYLIQLGHKAHELEILTLGVILILYAGVYVLRKSNAAYLIMHLILMFTVWRGITIWLNRFYGIPVSGGMRLYQAQDVTNLKYILMSLSYTFIGCITYARFWWKKMKDEEQILRGIFTIIYLIFGLVIIVMSSASGWVIATFVTIAAITLVDDYRRGSLVLSYIGYVLLTLAYTTFVRQILHLYGGYEYLMIPAVGLIMQSLTPHITQPLIKRAVDRAGYAFIGIGFFALATSSHGQYAFTVYWLILSLFLMKSEALGGATLRRVLSIGAITLAYLSGASAYGAMNTQYYIVPLSAYLFYAAWDLSHEYPTLSDLALVVGLFTLTFPTSMQALRSSATRDIYRLLILSYGIGILVVGLMIKRRLLQWWGTATIVGVVLYIIGPYLWSLPSWIYYLLIGGAFLAVAIRVLSKHSSSPHE